MTDKLHREFIQKQRSCLTNEFSEWIQDRGEWCNLLATYAGLESLVSASRRSMPACRLPQRSMNTMHQHGGLACLRKYTPDAELICRLDAAAPMEAERIAKEWFDEQGVKYRRLWQ